MITRWPIPTRIAAAAGLGVALVGLELVFPAGFVPLVALALILAPSINWRAWWRLRVLYAADAMSEQRSETLRIAMDRSWYLAVGSTVTALLGLFVALRAINIVPALPREAFLVILSYPPILAAFPAIDTLATLRRLEAGAAEKEGSLG